MVYFNYTTPSKEAEVQEDYDELLISLMKPMSPMRCHKKSWATRVIRWTIRLGAICDLKESSKVLSMALWMNGQVKEEPNTIEVKASVFV
ncbi:hypothetical protein HanPSC8_Chr15g0663371 [Helianthus annuus]|nr:hypothetical protein HanPSC8_Chr15g0663371 [Helianthus annuus]